MLLINAQWSGIIGAVVQNIWKATPGLHNMPLAEHSGGQGAWAYVEEANGTRTPFHATTI